MTNTEMDKPGTFIS